MKSRFYQTGLMSLAFFLLAFSLQKANAQRGRVHWATDGYQYYRITGGQIVELDTRDSAKKTVLMTSQMLTPKDSTKALAVASFSISDDGKKILLFTNTKRVWRYNTRGDYWVYDTDAKTLSRVGTAR